MNTFPGVVGRGGWQEEEEEEGRKKRRRHFLDRIGLNSGELTTFLLFFPLVLGRDYTAA